MRYTARNGMMLDRGDIVSGTAIVFASYMPDEHALGIGEEFLAVFAEHFADADVCIGVNPSACQDAWRARIAGCGLRARQALVETHRVIDSDASAFQAALTLLRDSGETYDLIWFGHTKGVTTKDLRLTRWFIDKLFRRRQAVERVFDDPMCGVYGLQAVLLPEKNVDVITPYCRLPYPQLDIMFTHTFYVCRGKPVHEFLRRCDRSFFDERIKGDRWFFERDFYQIVFMQGFHPVACDVAQLHFNNWDRVVSNRETFDARVRQWKEECR